MTLVFLLFYITGLQAQTIQTKPDQVELMKQFVGSWKADMAKDTTIFWEAKSYGTGIECNYKAVSKERIVLEGRQIYGFDKKHDIILSANLPKGMDIELLALWFTSNNKYEIIYYSDIANPEKAVFRMEGEFKSPDVYVETFILNGKPSRTFTYTRIK
jgi:hypothetical protein